jgi:hypothetical protein
MKSLFLFLSGCLLAIAADAQSKPCTQGCASTTVLLFDFDVKVDTANINASLKRQLFYIAPAFRKRLTSRTSCLDLLDGNEVKQPEDTYPEGAAPNVYVQGEGTYNLGEYLVTGFITGSGNSFVVTLNVETSISRKIIKTVTAATDVSNYQAVAEKLDATLGPLENIIQAYETHERDVNMKVAFGQPITRGTDASPLMVIKPKKIKLQMGEETEVEISLKDCDGYPLKNRTISFAGEMYDSLWHNGTYGGTVSPMKVVTDAQGKAKVMFKAGKQYAFAAIVAHYCFAQPCGRKDIITGSAAIDMQLKPYRVIACYTLETTTKQDFHSTTSEYTESRTGNSFSAVKHIIEFYYAPTEVQDGLSVNSIDTSSARIYVVQEKGISDDLARSNYLRRFHSGEIIYSTTQVNSNGKLSEGEGATVAADTSGLHLFSLALNLYKKGILNGQVMEPGIYPAAQVTAYVGDRHTTFKTVKSTDPTSPYKQSSIFIYNNQASHADNGTVTSTGEYFMVRIFVEK